MKRFLDKFAFRESEPLNRPQIIQWWGSRHIKFNLILFVCIMINCFTFYIIDNGTLDRFNLFSLIVGLFLANAFYTCGLIVELAIRYSNAWASRIFKIGIVFSICVTLLPAIICAVEVAINSERFSSPFSHFAIDEPSYKELIGTYKIDLNKANCISKTDIAEEPIVTLNANRTFSISSFPVFGSFTEYQLCDGCGHWRLDQNENPWQIRLGFDSLYNSKTLDPLKKNEIYFYIYNNKPPYKIYQMISDPDLWAGIIYERK